MKKKWYCIIGVVIILIVITLIIYKFKTENVRNYVDKYCSSDNDCTLFELGCCYSCGGGQPINKKSAETIKMINDFQCDRSMCPMVDCGSTAGWIINPKAVCKDNECVEGFELDCNMFCSQKKQNSTKSTEYIKNAANALNITIGELENRCTCD